jgi:hypothetical protein
MITAVFCLARVGSGIKRRISDDIRRAWQVSKAPERDGYLPDGLTYRFRISQAYRISSRILRLTVAPAFYAVLIAMLIIDLSAVIVGRSIILAQDANGLYCSSSALATPLPELTFELRASDMCRSTGFKVEEGQRYIIRIRQTSPWAKGDLPASMTGYSIADIGLGSRIFLALAAPFKRTLLRPWFNVILQLGEIGSEVYFFDPDPRNPAGELTEAFRATRSGELFIYVNDIVVPFPPFDFFYRQNSGTAQVSIMRR